MAVVGGGGEEELVRVELDVVDGAAVVVKLGHQFAGAQVPNLKSVHQSMILTLTARTVN